MYKAIVLFWFLGFICSAQQTTVSLYDELDYGEDGVYYKDIYNDLDVFEGTWELNSQNMYFKIVLEKKVMQQVQMDYDTFYEDTIVGEYRFVQNGIEKVNTLLNLNNPSSGYWHIDGNEIYKPSDYGCNDCGPNDIKINCLIIDPTCDNEGIRVDIILRHFIDNDIAKLVCTFRVEGMRIGNEPPCNYAIPILETYILTKVE